MRPTVEWDTQGNVDWKKEYLKVAAQLRQYTEAKPIAWQERNFYEGLEWSEWRHSKDGPEPPYYAGTPNYEIRALIVKLETEGNA